MQPFTTWVGSSIRLTYLAEVPLLIKFRNQIFGGMDLPFCHNMKICGQKNQIPTEIDDLELKEFESENCDQ